MRDEGLTFEEALEATRANNVFTTHTPVPAGIDLFDPGLMYHYFNAVLRAMRGIDFEQFMALGRRNPHDRDEPLLHGRCWRSTPRPTATPSAACTAQVSQEMWHDLWPQLPVWEMPDHLDHQRRSPAELAQRRSGRALRSVPASRTGASASTTRPSGSRCTRFPTKSCWKCTAAASAAW